MGKDTYTEMTETDFLIYEGEQRTKATLIGATIILCIGIAIGVYI